MQTEKNGRGAIRTRPAEERDRARCVWVEAGAIPNIRYIDAVWPLFTTAGDGDLTVALSDGAVGGMGKLTRLFGRYCWLEALRVHPDYQNIGLGKAIYRRYMAEMDEKGLSACGMYTGHDNARSRHLAELFGLKLAGRFDEYRAAPPEARTAPAFSPVAAWQGEAVLAPFYPRMGGFVAFNRTFFPAVSGLGAELARRGWLFRGPGGSVLAAGARFQPEAALHVAFAAGDTGACLAFAHALAAQAGAAALMAIWPEGDPAADTLTAAGFSQTPHRLITLWKGL